MSRSLMLDDWSGRGGGGMLNMTNDVTEQKKTNFGTRYTHAIQSIRYFVLIFWFLALLAGGWFGPKFLSNTKDVFDAPKGTPAAIAKEKWNELYTSNSHVHTLLALIHSESGKSLITDPEAMAFCASVDQALQTQLNKSDPTLENADSYGSITGYFEAYATAGPLGAANFLGLNDATMFWTIDFKPADESMTKQIGLHIRDVIQSLNTMPDTYSVGATGNDLLNYAIGEGTGQDMIHTDSIILPIAMFVLCCYLKSVRLMIIPLLCVGLSLVSAFSILLPIAKYAWNVASFAPAIMMSLTVAMSIDYSLFMLTRYREEILSGLHTREVDAVAATVTNSGEVILASGLTLAITFASLIAFPMDFLSSIGIGSSVTILCCLVVNLTFTPAMLLSFPRFFSDFRVPKFVRCILPKSYTEDVPSHRFGDLGLDDAFMPSISNSHSRRGGGGLEEELLYNEEEEDSLSQMPRSQASGKKTKSNSNRSINAEEMSVSTSVRHNVSIIGDDGLPPAVRQRRDNNPKLASLRARQKDSFWYKSAVLSTTTWVSVLLLLIVIGGCVPFLIACTHLEHTIDEGQLLPRGSAAVAVFDEVKEYLSPGILGQYNIMMVLDETKLPKEILGPIPIISEPYFNFTHQFVRKLLDQNLAANKSIASIGYVETIWIQSSEAAAFLAPHACPTNPLACLYEMAFKHSVNDGLNSTCSLIQITTSFPPLGDEAQPWLASVRDIMEEMQDFSNAELNGAISVYITGGATSSIDAVNRIYELFPYVVLCTVAVVLLVVGIVFRSLFVPLRLVLTLALPLVYCYGLCIWIFQENKMDWLGSVVANTHRIYWLDPVMAFSILVGLGLDYDIFLYSRVQEYRQLGYSNTASIRKGIYKTGAVITAAGAIMAIAFAGLMLSSELVLNIFGFMLCFSVLLDTFVIRTLLVPAILHLAGDANWFPTRMPTPVKGDLDQEGEDLLEAASNTAEAYSFR